MSPLSSLSPRGLRRAIALALGLLLASPWTLAQSDPPPARVARLGHAEGRVLGVWPGESNWSTLDPLAPLLPGTPLYVEPGARGEVQYGANTLRLDGATQARVEALDDHRAQFQLTDGAMSLRVRALHSGERHEIDTPNFAFVANAPGEYRFDVDAARGLTRVTLRSGSGTAWGEQGEAMPLTAPAQVVFSGRRLTIARWESAGPRDAFDTWVAARDLAEERSVSARHVSREVVGYQQLDAWGDWRVDAEYGSIWLPRVTVSDWAPYRYGRWRWIDPWGWTWIDDAPWGFAPFHYGRWVQVRNRWAWVPGPSQARPAYAPALVGFIGLSGISGNTQWNLALGSGGPAVGWFPLAPGETWRPTWRASPEHLSRYNPAWPRRDAQAPEYRYRQSPEALSAAPRDRFGNTRHGAEAALPRGQERVIPRLELAPPPPAPVSRAAPPPGPASDRSRADDRDGGDPRRPEPRSERRPETRPLPPPPAPGSASNPPAAPVVIPAPTQPPPASPAPILRRGAPPLPPQPATAPTPMPTPPHGQQPAAGGSIPPGGAALPMPPQTSPAPGLRSAPPSAVIPPPTVAPPPAGSPTLPPAPRTAPGPDAARPEAGTPPVRRGAPARTDAPEAPPRPTGGPETRPRDEGGKSDARSAAPPQGAVPRGAPPPGPRGEPPARPPEAQKPQGAPDGRPGDRDRGRDGAREGGRPRPEPPERPER